MDSSNSYTFGFGPFEAYPPEENEEVWEMLKKRYRELRENEWSDEAFLAILNEYEADLFDSGAYARDLERWPESAHRDEMEDLREFKAYVLERLHYCDSYYQ